MHDDMVERVAEAIARHSGYDTTLVARAAIEAMREPTNGMAELSRNSGMIDPAAELQMNVLEKMRSCEDKDVQFLIWQLDLDGTNENYHRAIKSFRRQIIIAAADYAFTNGE